MAIHIETLYTVLIKISENRQLCVTFLFGIKHRLASIKVQNKDMYRLYFKHTLNKKCLGVNWKHF